MPNLGDFPSLKDLETSNLYSNRFHGELAHKLALQSLGSEDSLRHKAMKLMMQLILDRPLTFREHFEKLGKKNQRNLATSAF